MGFQSHPILPVFCSDEVHPNKKKKTKNNATLEFFFQKPPESTLKNMITSSVLVFLCFWWQMFRRCVYQSGLNHRKIVLTVLSFIFQNPFISSLERAKHQPRQPPVSFYRYQGQLRSSSLRPGRCITLCRTNMSCRGRPLVEVRGHSDLLEASCLVSTTL